MVWRQGWSPSILVFVAFALGCGRNPDLPFPDHTKDYLPAVANPGFNAFTEAAQMVEDSCAKWIGRISFTQGQKTESIKASAKAISKIRTGLSEGVNWVHRPYSPLSPPGERRGWRFIGRVLVWRIQNSIESRDFDNAIADCIVAVRMGVALTGGDAIDANLGHTIAREATAAIWSSFADMSPSQLLRLYEGSRRSLEQAPTLEATLRNERATMLKAVQTVQDCFIDGDLNPLDEALGSVIAPATTYLKRLKTRSNREQVAYFRGFAAEATQEADSHVAMAQTPPAQWKPFADPTGDRPWKRFASAYLRSGRELLVWWVEFQSRMRLFTLDTALLAKLKSSGLPKDLSRFPRFLSTDPYSGQSFRYLSQGRDYQLYGWGKDRRDDSGDSNRDAVPER